MMLNAVGRDAPDRCGMIEEVENRSNKEREEIIPHHVIR